MNPMMNQPPVPRHRYPVWVKLFLWGIHSRSAALIWGWLCVVAGVNCILFGMILQSSIALLMGLACLPGALCYWAGMRWVDKYGEWEKRMI